MAKKKAAAARPEVCPECKGTKRGRGYAHSEGCSLARSSGSSSSSGTRRSRGVDMRSVRALSVDELFALQEDINGVLRDKRDEIEQDIKNKQALLKKIP